MDCPEIPPVDLLNQLAPDVKEYLLNKVNRYYREQRGEENRQNIRRQMNSGQGFICRSSNGKIIRIV